MNTIQYKGFTGTIEYSSEDDCLIGQVLNVQNAVIVYEGQSVAEITAMFHQAVDEYIQDNQQIEISLPVDIQQKIDQIAAQKGQTPNEFVRQTIELAL